MAGPNEENVGFEQFKAGNEQALGQLHALYRRRLMYFALKFSLTEDEAEEIAADCFFKLWQSRDKIASVAHLRNFLFLTVRNSALNLREYNERRQEYQARYNAEQDTAFSHERVEAEMLHLIYSGINTLPAECQKILRLYLDDLSTEEIAGRLSISAATVRSQKRRAIQLLRKWIAQLPGAITGGLIILLLNFFRHFLHTSLS